MIACENLSLGFGGKTILHNLSFSLNEGLRPLWMSGEDGMETVLFSQR